MSGPEVTIHLIVPDRVAGLDLTDEEKIRAGSFHFEKDAKHWSACRTALRRTLGRLCGASPLDLPILSGSDGKPVLAPPFQHVHFNLSHCENLALIATAGFPVGIDVEPLNRASTLLGCESSFCHPDEIAELPVDTRLRAIALLEIWTAKEAALKALGTGLIAPPENVIVDFKNSVARSQIPLDGLESLTITRLHHPLLSDHAAFLAVPEKDAVVAFHEGSD